jgi:hypothetical protein
MAVLSSTATITPVIGTETQVATIAPGNPLDNITVYFQGGTGGGGGSIGLALYAVVGGFNTRVAQAQVQGSTVASIVEWQTIGSGSSETENFDAAGTSYIVTAIDLSNGLPAPGSPARGPITITLAGVDFFDTQADANAGQTFSALTPGSTGTLSTFNGYAQLMDVALDQTNLPGVTVAVAADCGAGTVQATVIQTTSLIGRDTTIAAVFRGLKLPVATRYFVSVTNSSQVNVTVTLTAVTYSVNATAGGGTVTLTGNANGPSNNNTVQAFATSTTNAPINIGSQAHPTGFIYEGFNGLTGNQTITLNATPTKGDMVVIKDEDGSLASFNMEIIGNGHNIDGNATVTMTSTNPGAQGSYTLLYNGTEWAIV